MDETKDEEASELTSCVPLRVGSEESELEHNVVALV